jgi:hypothetical protein
MRFGGVDFTSVPTQVAAHRSPDACNMIANEKFFPVKRPGYRVFGQYGARIYGLHRLVTQEGGTLFVHAGGNLYVQDETAQTPVPVYTQMAQNASRSFVMGGKLYLLDGNAYLCAAVDADGTAAVQPVSDGAFVPTTSIARTRQARGRRLSGEPLTRKRKNSFAADGRACEFQLDFSPVASVDAVSWTAGCAVHAYSVDLASGVVSFQTARAGRGRCG